MSNELKPCPFCGRTEAKLTKCRAGWAFGWHVTCKHCLSVGATAYSDRVGVGARTPEERERAMKAYAVANWNRRTTSDHIVATNKKVDDNPPQAGGDTMNNDLRPCLRCGGAVTLKRTFIIDGVVWFYIVCEKCREMTNVFRDERALRDEWNLVRHESAYSMPDNMPLTTQELLGMDGKPVYLVFGTIEDGGLSEQWDLVDVDENDRAVYLVNSVGDKLTVQFDEEISGMRVYRKRPEDKKQ